MKSSTSGLSYRSFLFVIGQAKIFRINFLVLLLALISTVTSNAHQLQISDFAIFSGNGGPGTTNPGASGYGVIFGSSSTINGGAIGSYSLMQTTGGANFSCNIFSQGKVILANGNTVTGRITAANSAAVSGNIVQVGSNAVLSGIIDANGNVNVQSGTVTGPVH